MKKKQTKWMNVLVVLCVCFFLHGCSVESEGDVILQDGITAYENGNYLKAIELLKEAEQVGLEEYEIGDLYAVMGNSYLEMDMFEDAFTYYEKSLEQNPSSVVYIVNLAVAYRQYDDYEKAMELYEKALEIDPDYAELNSSLGSLYIIYGDSEKAIYYFENAIEQDPSLAVAYGNAALAYAMNGDFEKAQEYLQKADSLGYNNVAIIQERINELK